MPPDQLHPLARVRALREIAYRTPGLDRYAREVFTALLLRTDEDGRTMVGQVRLAKEAGCCERTVRKRVATLERAGLFWRARSGPRGLTMYQTACPTLDVLDTPTAARIWEEMQRAGGARAPAAVDQTGIITPTSATDVIALALPANNAAVEQTSTAVTPTSTGDVTHLRLIDNQAVPTPATALPATRWGRRIIPGTPATSARPIARKPRRRGSQGEPPPILAPRTAMAALTVCAPDPQGALEALTTWREREVPLLLAEKQRMQQQLPFPDTAARSPRR